MPSSTLSNRGETGAVGAMRHLLLQHQHAPAAATRRHAGRKAVAWKRRQVIGQSRAVTGAETAAVAVHERLGLAAGCLAAEFEVIDARHGFIHGGKADFPQAQAVVGNPRSKRARNVRRNRRDA